MGKADDELTASALSASSATEAPGGRNVCTRCLPMGGRIVRPRCVAALILGAAVLLSALFWLPPFLRHSGGAGGRDQDPMYTADIVASFRLQRPVNLLYDNIVKLQYDILEEIQLPDSLVAVISLEPLGGSNWTNIVFEVLPYKSSNLSSTSLSILRSSFMSLVVQQSTLHLTTSLFGNASFFEVLKFTGGITIVPPQSVFPLQKVQMLFNFTLNFPIHQVQQKINELKDQMKSGLLLNYNENLYVRLTNLEGSTVSPPTIVQTSVVLAIGNQQPSLPRLKQLAQNIRNSSAGNLGLNHTVFGRVKQIRLSSFLQHSLNGGAVTGSPSPSPLPHLDHHHHHQHHHHHLHHHHHHHHHRHHHHHHHHHHDRYSGAYLAPSPNSAPAPAPKYGPTSPAPCHQYTYSNKPKHSAYLPPSAAPRTIPRSLIPPSAAPLHSALPLNAPQRYASPVNAPEHSAAPFPGPGHLLARHAHVDPPVPAPSTLPESPLPSVSFARIPPPSGSVTDKKPHIGKPAVAPSPYASFASHDCCICWVLVLLFYALTTL